VLIDTSEERRVLLTDVPLGSAANHSDISFADSILATAELLPVGSLEVLQRLTAKLAEGAAVFDKQLATIAERRAAGGLTAADRAVMLALAGYASKNGAYPNGC
jgi:hypothetical protein